MFTCTICWSIMSTEDGLAIRREREKHRRLSETEKEREQRLALRRERDKHIVRNCWRAWTGTAKKKKLYTIRQLPIKVYSTFHRTHWGHFKDKTETKTRIIKCFGYKNKKTDSCWRVSFYNNLRFNLLTSCLIYRYLAKPQPKPPFHCL